MVQADYSQIVSCLHGQTAKQLHQLFLAATQHDAILFFDEADALVSKRISMHADRLSIASAINTERNAFMQELDRFNGIVILTTNFFKNFDDAMVRRVAQHVQFKKPNRKMRVELFKSHIPNMDRVREIDWDRLATRALGLSGGDIFQAVVNAINAVSLDPNPDNWWLTEPSLNVEVDRILEAKAQHSGSTRKGMSLTVKPDPAGETPPPAAPQLED